MAYKIVSQAKAWWPIRFNGLTEDGETVVNEVQGRFIILDEDEFQQFETDVSTLQTAIVDPDGSKKMSELLSPFFMRILEDWKDVVEDDGTETGKSVPFTEANLQRMLRVPNFATAASVAFREARKAEPKRREGN